MKIPRRNFLVIACASLLRGDDRPKLDMLARAIRPEALEMPLSGFSDYITPIEHFFVRTHVYVPKVNLDSWRLRADGEVATPLTLTMDDLRKLPPAELVSVVECAGNVPRVLRTASSGSTVGKRRSGQWAMAGRAAR